MAEEVGPSQETFANPFLMDDAAGDEADAPSDNPFFEQASNPFADFQQTADVTATATEDEAINTSFFDTTIHDADEVAVPPPPVQINVAGGDVALGDFYSSEDELEKVKKPGPPPPPRPGPPIAAQHLISTVAGQLDLASHDLLGRIPVTRTPSPVSMRDLHTPSPTPDDNLLMDDPMSLEEDQVVAAPVFEEPKLPPARPPPRPQPPPKPEPPQMRPQQQQVVAQEPDIMDMFGVDDTPAPTRPPPPKTNQDILSLFSAPVEPEEEVPQTDLLTEEIPIYTPASPAVIEEIFVAPEPEAAPIETIEEEMETQQLKTPETIPEPEPVTFHSEVPADSPFASEPDDFVEAQPVTESPPAVAEVEPRIEPKVISPVSNPFADLPPARPAPPPRPAVPPPKPAPPAVPAYVPARVEPVAPPIPIQYVPPVAHVSAPAPAAVIPSAFSADPDDEFDAFSAKFNSAQKVEKTNIFLDDPAVDGEKPRRIDNLHIITHVCPIISFQLGAMIQSLALAMQGQVSGPKRRDLTPSWQ